MHTPARQRQAIPQLLADALFLVAGVSRGRPSSKQSDQKCQASLFLSCSGNNSGKAAFLASRSKQVPCMLRRPMLPMHRRSTLFAAHRQP